MASILTNTSAMVALQNLRTINSNLVDTQNQIATGKKIATATDNSAIWAVSKVIESDVSAFKAISDSLNLGDSTVAVAREAAETVTDILTELKGNIVAAQEENVDRSKIQADIDTKVEQINSIIDAASFNGLSLVEGTGDVNILGSLVRDGSGSVAASDIAIARQDLGTSAGVYGGGGDSLAANTTDSDTAIADTANTATVVLAAPTGGTFTIGVNGNEITVTGETAVTAATDAAVAAINALGLDGITAANVSDEVVISSTKAFETVAVTAAASGGSATVDAGSGAGASDSAEIAQRAETVAFSATAAVNEGDSYRVTIDGANYDYIAGPGETMEDVARGLKIAVDGAGLDGITTQVQESGGQFSLAIDNDGSGSSSVTLASTGENGGTASGGLFGLQNIDVTTDASASAALSNIDTFINTAIDASASFGSDQARIELQSGFISTLTDSLKAGIGSLVDADLEAASARLQALQVQQQLGIQSLSIANQAPQSILSLFR